MAPGGTTAARPARPSRTARERADRRTIAVVAGAQVATALGYYAVMGHLTAYLRDDVGVLAGMIGLVLGTRFLVQSALQPLLGSLTDVLGPARSGALACLLRTASFALLAVADGQAGLLGAACLLGAGGSLYVPAVQALIAGTSPKRRSTGFAAYLAGGQITAAVAPLVGLAALRFGGFGLVSGGAAGCWAIAGALFWYVFWTQRHDGPEHRHAGAGRAAGAGRETVRGLAGVVRDRVFLRFVLATAGSLLLAGATTSVVPLTGVGKGSATAFFCVVAAATAAVQPWCAARGRAGRPRVLQLGMLLMGGCYLVLLLPAGPAGVVVAAVLNGAGQGLMQPAVFAAIAGYAPAERVGAHLGLYSFVSGMAVFGGDIAVGSLFDAGSAGATAALAALAVLGPLSAAACIRPLSRRT